MTQLLPSFLEDAEESKSSLLPRSALYHHTKTVKGKSHVLYWPPSKNASSPSTVAFFIPGNPGQVDFFKITLGQIHERYSDRLAIFAQAHMGHTPRYIPTADDGSSYSVVPSALTLDVQVQNALEMYDSIRETYPYSKILLMGHSIGSWILLRLLKERPNQALAAILICPTISNIASTPNGLSLAWIFPPLVARLLSSLSIVLTLLPLSIFRLFLSKWPNDQLMVIRDFICSPAAVLAVLTMARCEMQQVRDLDVSLLQENKEKIYIYYARRDDWVGQEKDSVIKAIGDSDRIFHDKGDTPHAFTARHSLEVATQCLIWLDTLSI